MGLLQFVLDYDNQAVPVSSPTYNQFTAVPTTFGVTPSGSLIAHDRWRSFTQNTQNDLLRPGGENA